MVATNSDRSSDENEGSISSSSSDVTASGESVQEIQPDVSRNFDHVPPDTLFARSVQRWTIQVPIGLGLCPWAGKSHNEGRLRYVTCSESRPCDVAKRVSAEVKILVEDNLADWCSTLVVCPNVKEWIDFPTFERYVRSFEHSIPSMKEQVTLVSFHPDFWRWRGLPPGMEVGTQVQSHWGMIGRKSAEKANATIVETRNKAFGLRKVKVRFHQSLVGRRPEQYVPVDWIDDTASAGPLLPDNVMHRAPHPTIHLISNKDLAGLSIRDISRVKRKNSQKMATLGWEGIKARLGDIQKGL